jgi:hypothetical protein
VGFFSNLCAKSGESIPVYPWAKLPKEQSHIVSVLPDDTVIEGIYNGYGRVVTPQGEVNLLKATEDVFKKLNLDSSFKSVYSSQKWVKKKYYKNEKYKDLEFSKHDETQGYFYDQDQRDELNGKPKKPPAPPAPPYDFAGINREGKKLVQELENAGIKIVKIHEAGTRDGWSTPTFFIDLDCGHQVGIKYDDQKKLDLWVRPKHNGPKLLNIISIPNVSDSVPNVSELISTIRSLKPYKRRKKAITSYPTVMSVLRG